MKLKNLTHYILEIPHLPHIALLLILIWLTGCGSDPFEVQEPDPKPILMSTDNRMAFHSEYFSRAEDDKEDDPDSASPIDPDSASPIDPETAGLFGNMEDYIYSIFDDQIVYRKDGKSYLANKLEIENQLPLNFIWDENNNWVYAPLRSWSGKDYQFYCYAPHSSTEGTNVTLTLNRYKAMTSFLMTHIPPYSSYDYTIASNYKFGNKGVVTFPMKHISARICLRMKIGEEYSKLRKILIKKITVKDRDEGGTYFQCLYTLNNDETLNKMTVTSNGSYTPKAEDPNIPIVPIFNDEEGLKLYSDTYQQYGSLYVMPQKITSLTINVTYDVYDHKSEEPVRLNAEVSNTIPYFKEVEGGKYYNINIVVSPEYLYVLSDNDIKPDGLISIPDPGTNQGSDQGTNTIP